MYDILKMIRCSLININVNVIIGEINSLAVVVKYCQALLLHIVG